MLSRERGCRLASGERRLLFVTGIVLFLMNAGGGCGTRFGSGCSRKVDLKHGCKHEAERYGILGYFLGDVNYKRTGDKHCPTRHLRDQKVSKVDCSRSEVLVRKVLNKPRKFAGGPPFLVWSIDPLLGCCMHECVSKINE